MHSFKCCDNFFLFCHIIIFFRILSVSGLTFHHEVIEKKQKMKFTFTQVRLIKMSKKQFVGFRAGRPGFLLGGVQVRNHTHSSMTLTLSYKLYT